MILDPVLYQNNDLHVMVGHNHPASDNLVDSTKLKDTMQENVPIHSHPCHVLAAEMLSVAP